MKAKLEQTPQQLNLIFLKITEPAPCGNTLKLMTEGILLGVQKLHLGPLRPPLDHTIRPPYQ